MRWIFADPAHPEELLHRRRTTAAIDHWWQSFQAKTAEIDALFNRKAKWDLVEWMSQTLGAVHPQLMWEYGPAVTQPGHRLVITPESCHWLRPVVQSLLERAPPIPGWEFYAHRLQEDVDMTVQAVEARVGVNITGAALAASMAQGRKIDLWFAFPQQPELDDETAANAAFVATETLMGEYVLDTWIGGIDLLNNAPTKLRPLPLDQGQATVEAVIRSIGEQLPQNHSQHIGEPDGIWSAIQLTPVDPAEDYLGRDDLFVANTSDVERFHAAHNGKLFSSACHSRLGERFCYLKLDALDVPRESLIAFRSKFEDALNPALMEADAGCCVGGGTGHRYLYIDLALTNVNRSVEIIRRVLAAGQAPLRTWLLFFDSEWSREWVGVYPQTLPPPLPTDD